MSQEVFGGKKKLKKRYLIFLFILIENSSVLIMSSNTIHAKLIAQVKRLSLILEIFLLSPDPLSSLLLSYLWLESGKRVHNYQHWSLIRTRPVYLESKFPIRRSSVPQPLRTTWLRFYYLWIMFLWQQHSESRINGNISEFHLWCECLQWLVTSIAMSPGDCPHNVGARSCLVSSYQNVNIISFPFHRAFYSMLQ